MGTRLVRSALSLCLIAAMVLSNSSAIASTKWPPKGFSANGDVYAKIPTAQELTALLTSNRTLAAQSKTCITYACGIVQVTSRIGCTWWEINSTVTGPRSTANPTRTPLGTLRVTYRATIPKRIVTIYLRSREPLRPKISVNNILISCYHSPVTELIPSTVYKRVSRPTPTPTPTPTPSTSISESATPTPSAT